jgi:integrase
MGYVYTRGRVLWIGYTDLNGKPQQKSTGYHVGEEDKAREVLREVEAAIAARVEYAPEGGALTLERFADPWLKARRSRGVATVDDDETRLRLHVFPVLGSMELEEIRPRHVRALVAGLTTATAHQQPTKEGETKSPPRTLAPRTQSNVLATLRALFADAVADEVLRSSPVVIKREEVPTRIDADPRWRPTAIFEVFELQLLVRTDRIPDDRRVMCALMGLAGLRFGEAAALRWRDLQPAEPLPRIWVAGSYSTKTKEEKLTKTEVPRAVPVIPELGALLEQWRTVGWVELRGRKPEPDDLVCPSRRGACRSVNHGRKKLSQDLERLGLRDRRQHDLRRTFVSLCRAGGADEGLLKWITHGPPATVLDSYTTLPWPTLCAQLHGLHLQLTYSRSKVLELQGEIWRGGRDSNQRPGLKRSQASAGTPSDGPGNTDVFAGPAAMASGQAAPDWGIQRQGVRTVSEVAQELLELCGGDLEAARGAIEHASHRAKRQA